MTDSQSEKDCTIRCNDLVLLSYVFLFFVLEIIPVPWLSYVAVRPLSGKYLPTLGISYTLIKMLETSIESLKYPFYLINFQQVVSIIFSNGKMFNDKEIKMRVYKEFD